MTKAIPTTSPAIEAAEKAQALVSACIKKGRSFLLEAGAGAGKTHSFIVALKDILAERAAALLAARQQVACITYTNVASDEIKIRTDAHPAMAASTIHAFCWGLIKDFQPDLRRRLPAISGWPERFADSGVILGKQHVEYDLGYRKATPDALILGHSDVITLTVNLLEEAKFRSVVAARYPIIFIDEYQDTNAAFAGALVKHFVTPARGPLIGFFGDHWQKIYSDGVGKIEAPNLEVVGKQANFRSVPAIVHSLNTLRPQLTQEVSDPSAIGSVRVFHSNGWRAERRTDGHWKGDLPPADAQASLKQTRELLASEGWDFSPSTTKILMLTHTLLAREQGYASFGEVFDRSESYIGKEDQYIAFLVDTLEPACDAFARKRYGEMFSALGRRIPHVSSHADKEKWATEMASLMVLREKGTIGQVIARLRQGERPRLPDRVLKKEDEFERYLATAPSEPDKAMETRRKLGEVPYCELIALDRYIDDKTPFSTKHGVKGAEFENVLVVIGRGWNLYDFNSMLEWIDGGVPKGKESSFERNRNLFYVACSRPKRRLALLFTQQLSPPAINALRRIFGANALCDLYGERI